MNEIFLIYLWEQRLLRLPLHTTEGLPVAVLHPGLRNLDAGPDFLQARIRIGDTIWAGSVEMHINAGDWYKHRHDADPAYENVVLHVVYHEDRKVFDKHKQLLPTLEVKGRFDEHILLNYRRFIDSRDWLPCAKQAQNAQRFTWLSWLDRMATERLEEKTISITRLLEQTKFDWDEAFWRLLLINMGFKVNQQGFEMLGQRLPFNLMLRHADQLLQLEALLLGTAGLLRDYPEDVYANQLYREFQFLQRKYNLYALPAGVWKFMRMRPANFPTLRMAQLAMLVHKHGRLFAKSIEEEPANLKALFEVEASHYWQTHYRPGEPSPPKTKKIGADAVALILINTVARLLFAWGNAHKDQASKDKAMLLLENLPPEENQVTKRFTQVGIAPTNALHSQALLHLHANYCQPRLCLECRIGHLLIRNASAQNEN